MASSARGEKRKAVFEPRQNAGFAGVFLTVSSRSMTIIHLALLQNIVASGWRGMMIPICVTGTEGFTTAAAGTKIVAASGGVLVEGGH
ncbi:hypothetical protein KCP77_22270 [Salmonella enterica subsp. enterica]|nr:hypothetical protein KCP77_22270 [Salmonella enterica subsp. enterica]